MHYEEVKMLLERSSDFLEFANRAFKDGKYSLATFLAEQAVQPRKGCRVR
ncbi:HEPN domain-containing protein [Pyrococcus yayanosii]|uniref:HEPN domain-containing protein n=1 Tax=Pyrococcus yayanosii (strain CH1 / JCM 16557) TaxID=529709 RepID=F8AHR5_PYRYC|nr:HEPN domain-containing protein [Pyrococcus yayanosii]AEH24198.1 hypothetical protein PYCH_05080 [Pyrococcus yayanosii CH1]